MNKYKYLLENTILFALSGVIVKIISFFMLPLYTNELSTADYGIAELMNTTITLLMPILSLSIAEAVIRFALIKNKDKQSIFTISVLICLGGVIILCLLKPLFKIFFAEINDFFGYFVVMYLTSVLENNFFRFAKGLEKVKECSINGIVIVIVTVASNLILLLKYKMGLEGYLISIILAQIASSVYLLFVCRVWRYFNLNKVNKQITKEMLLYSIPIIPTSIAWWINSAFDRYMIVFMLGVSANGLFSAASKLPSIINVITSIFTQAWQLSGIKEYDSNEYESFFSNIYNFYNAIMVTAISVLIPITPLIAKFMFASEFYEAWKYAPILYVSTLFTGLSGVLASVFHAVKKTKTLMNSTLIGAGLNIIMNYVLIKMCGIQGAGISTMISFFGVWVIRYNNTKKYIKIKLNKGRTIIMYLILLIQIILLLMENYVSYIISALLVIAIIALNSDVYINVIGRVLGVIKSRVKKLF